MFITAISILNNKHKDYPFTLIYYYYYFYRNLHKSISMKSQNPLVRTVCVLMGAGSWTAHSIKQKKSQSPLSVRPFITAILRLLSVVLLCGPKYKRIASIRLYINFALRNGKLNFFSISFLKQGLIFNQWFKRSMLSETSTNFQSIYRLIDLYLFSIMESE